MEAAPDFALWATAGRVEFVLPLLGEASRADDKAALEVATCDELFHKEPCHDGLPCPGVVGEEKAQGLARKHRLVDGRGPVREGIDERGVDPPSPLRG